MQIDLRVHRKLYHALYSDVFVVEGRVYKLFKRFGQASFDERAATLFEAQCDAYGRASMDTILKKHTPQFYGPCIVEEVVDEEGENISERYRLDACYALEELNGPEEKVNATEIRTNYPYVYEVRKRFSNQRNRHGRCQRFLVRQPRQFQTHRHHDDELLMSAWIEALMSMAERIEIFQSIK